MRIRLLCRFLFTTPIVGLSFLTLWNLPTARGQDDDKNVTIRRQQELIERLDKELGSLNKTIMDRERAILKLEADAKVSRLQNKPFEERARILQNEQLLEQCRKLIKAFGAQEILPGVGPILIPKDVKPNPPPVNMDGKVEKVDGMFVQVSLGKDHGLKKGHTLEVYRLQPEPKYLGSIRIVDVNFHTSFGRYIPPDNMAERPMLKVGDLVTSKLAKCNALNERSPQR